MITDGGHDSQEDAASCMKLMLMKATREMHKYPNQQSLFDVRDKYQTKYLGASAAGTLVA